jgi:hypothetical protein
VENTALVINSAVLINSASANNPIVATSVDGKSRPAAIQTVSFDMGREYQKRPTVPG